MRTLRTILASAVLFLGGLTLASAQGTLFTYQGRLELNGAPANGLYTFGFLLRDAASGGTLLGNTSQPGVGVTNGVFTVPLDFGNKFDGSPRWLQITVATNGAIPSILHPYQPITPTPYAIFSSQAGSVPNGAIGSAQLANSIDLGTTNVNGRLDVYRTAANTPAISLIGSSSQISAYGNDGQEKVRVAGEVWGQILLNGGQAGNDRAVTLSALGPLGGGFLSLCNTNGATRGWFSGQSSTGSGELRLHDANGTSTVEMTGAEGSGSGSQLVMKQANGTTTIQLDAEVGSGGGGYLRLYKGNGSTGLTLQTDVGGELRLHDASGTSTIEMIGAEGSGSGSQLVMKQANGTQTIQLDAEAGADGGGFIQLYKGDGTVGITLRADASGEGKITTQVLQITGGSDLSEQFDIQAGRETLQPGMIVCIDSEHPGQLITSTKAYDRTVAGVMSGAGGVKPGMLMGQQGTAADGKHPVALTGRVYCEADASNGPIHPGDLLTTSNTPGHAMKVTDYPKAQGAIIGKAMSALDKGQGLVLVLVSLQ